MNRANQQALFQATNQAVLGIRQLEITYYANLYGAFGTQALLLGGFVYGTFTQNNTDEGNPGEDVFIFLYYVMAALTIASAVHIMLCTMVLQVYGPGLALHGPLGSMARASEGLQLEQDQVIVSFIFMIFCFALSTVWCFWTVMTTKEALTSTVVFVLAARQWYYYSERIYLRFYWNKNESNWNSGGVEDEMEFDNEPQVPGSQEANTNPLHRLPTPQKSQYKEKKLRFPFAMPFSGKRTGEESEGTDSDIPPSPATQGTAISADMRGVDLKSLTKSMVAMEGYFTCRGRSEHQVVLDSKKWERQYFVLFKTGEFYVYKTRQAFRTDPKNPVFIRPLRLTDRLVRVDNTDQAIRSEFDDESRSVASTAVTVKAGRDATKPLPFRFQITLVPRENDADYDLGQKQLRNHWVLRCDTEEELEIWVGSIRDLCPSCFEKTEGSS
jgi:hypothetical protein